MRGASTQDLAVTCVAAWIDFAALHGSPNRTSGLLKVRAIAEAAAMRAPLHLEEGLCQLARCDRTKAELCHAGAIYKEAALKTIEPRGRRRLAPETVT